MDYQYTIEEIKSRVDIIDVAQKYGLNLKRQGNEYVSLCCFHEEKTPSLTFTPSNGTYFCFGGCGGGDVFNFVQEYEQLSKADTVKRLKEFAGITDDQGRSVPEPPKPKQVNKPHDPMDDWQVIMPVPSTAPKLMEGGRTIPVYNPKSNDGKGKLVSYKPEPEGVYPYRSSDKQLLGAVLRIIINGQKVPIPVTYCVNKNTGEERWVSKKFTSKRPLYGIDVFDNNDQVLIVEGEKCVDVAHNHVGQSYDVCSWPMGTNAVSEADWSHIYGRDVVLWADNDIQPYKSGPKKGEIKPVDEQNGRKAMLWIKKHLEQHECNVTLLDQPENKPDGWDCADAVDESVDLHQYIVDHTPEPEYTSADQQEDNLPAQSKSEIVPLGYDDGRFYYYSKFTNQIKMLRDKEHGKTALLGLAPIEWWLSKFDNGKGKVEWDESVSYLMQACRNVGIFDKRKIRGRGCWVDDGRFVLHLGDRLIVDGETVELGSFRSTNVYQAAARKKAPSNALTDKEAEGLIEAVKTFDWEMPASAALLAGFCVLAPICSSLKWRPHIWITGGSGSGKSTVFDLFVKQAIGDMGVYSSLESTSAGLTQRMKADGFPIIFEEFDPSKNKRADLEKAQGFFNLMRLASDDSDIEILRGSASGESITYNINSMFCLIGIQICTNEQAILNRTAQLTLKSRANKTDQQKEANKAQWDNIKSVFADKVMPIENLSGRLLARTLGMIDIIQHNIKVFRKAANKHFGNARHADQYGTLLAGAYSLRSDCRVKEDVALNFIDAYDWTVYTEDTEEDESMQALNSILQLMLFVETEGAPRPMSVIEAIKMVQNQDGVFWREADKVLRRFGVVVDQYHFTVSNRSDSIESELRKRDKPWATNWGKYLKRITGPDGEKTRGTKNAVSFAGISQRGTEIPFEIINSSGE